MNKPVIKQDIALLKQIRDFAGGPLIGTFISMITVPITTRLVSPVEFGKSALFTLVQTLFSLIALFGLDQAFVRYYNSKELTKNKLLYNVIIFPFSLSLLSVLFIVLFKKPLSFWLFEQNEPVIMILFCFFLPALIVHRFALLIIRMELKGKLYSILNIFAQINHLICLLLLLFYFERSFRAIVIAIIFSTIINAVISLIFTKNTWTLRIQYFDKYLLKELLKFGIPLVPATLLSWLLDSFDKIGLRQWSNYEQLGLYAAAFKIVALLAVLQTVFTTAWIPIAFRWYEDNENVIKFDFVSVLVLGFMTIAYAGIVVLRDIVLLFLGSEYRNISSILIYLLFIPVMYTISETTTLGIAFSKKTYFNLYVSLICVILSVTANYFLIPVFGAKGAALSTAVAYLAFFWARTLFSRRLWYKFKFDKYIINILLIITLAVFVEIQLFKLAEIFIFLLIIFFNLLNIKRYYTALSGDIVL